MRNWILALLRVPPEPHPPEGSAESVRVFRAGRNYYRFLLLGWCLANVGAVAGFAAGYMATRRLWAQSPPWARWVWLAVEVAVVGTYLASSLAAFFGQRWNFELRWYIVTDRSLRIRDGIWSTHELTTTFANIQEIRVSAGPIQKLLGLADVEVHSAGGGGGGPHGGGGHVARFDGLDNANEIRDFLVESLKRYRDSGLGEAKSEGPSSTLAAAQGVLDEVRNLRMALARKTG